MRYSGANIGRLRDDSISPISVGSLRRYMLVAGVDNLPFTELPNGIFYVKTKGEAYPLSSNSDVPMVFVRIPETHPLFNFYVTSDLYDVMVDMRLKEKYPLLGNLDNATVKQLKDMIP